MIKCLFVVINSLVLFIFNFFNGDAITVSSNIPGSFNVGQEISVELKINKGEMNGFAKLQFELPPGVVIKESEDKGASYSFDEGIAKWSWAALPSGNEIVINLILVASESALGTKTFSLKYSYVENNVKQSVEMVPAEVNIVAPGLNNKVQEGAAANQNTVSGASSNSNREPVGDIVVVRTINRGASDNEFIITIKIIKGLTRGFARYSDDLPEGLTAKAIKTEGSSFSVADGKVKFVWVNVPEKEELDISYMLSGSSSNPVVLNGEYAYLEENQSKKYLLVSETIMMSAGSQTTEIANEEIPRAKAVEIETPVWPRDTVNAVATNTPEVTKDEMEAKEKESDAEDVKNKTENISPEVLEKKESKIYFVVQIGAFKNPKISAEKLKNKFKIREQINSEMQEGFSKFMVGSHKEYKSARDQREIVIKGNGVKSAFIAAYNQGKRITVQEALMITNQKWLR